jgi:hypothetical protein
MSDKKQLPKDTYLDGIFGSEAIDSSGEVLDVDGCDISDGEIGVSTAVWEHRGDDANGASANDHVGKVVYIKKIFKEEDCDTPRERACWKKVKCPFIYGIIRLADGSGHPGAIALAAFIRDQVAHNEKIIMRLSVEGSTLEKKGNRLTKTIFRRIAVTVKPCNKSCDIGILEDPHAAKVIPKEGEFGLPDANKSEADLMYAKIGQSHDIVDENPVLDLAKAIDGGGYNVAPSMLTGGGALAVEDQNLHNFKNRALAAYRDRPRDGSSFKTFLKMRLPEADPKFIDKFGDMVDQYRIKKSIKDEDCSGLLMKFEVLELELAKKINDLQAPDSLATPDSVNFGGKTIKPGAGRIWDDKSTRFKDLGIVGHDSEHWFTVPHEKLGSFGSEHVSKIPKSTLANDFQIHQYPLDVKAGHKIDSNKHGDPKFNILPAQSALIHGLNPHNETERPEGANEHGFANETASQWVQGPKGATFLKANPNEVKKEALFHNLAHSFFGLGHYVPTTAIFNHPQTGRPHAAIQGIPGAEHVPYKDKDFQNILKATHDSGDLQKLAVMDMISGNDDRHEGNYMMVRNPTDGGPQLRMIDHGLTYKHNFKPTNTNLPDYLKDLRGAAVAPVQDSTVKWLNKLDPNKLKSDMESHGEDPDIINETVRKLQVMKYKIQHPENPGVPQRFNDILG